jgi:crossover junction endodeoxyribonuclease RuvC
VELGTVIRSFLHRSNLDFIEVAPTALKKFVTGKGSAKKEVMILELFKRWQREFKDNDQADAFGLMKFGEALLGQDVGLPKSHLEPVELVKVKICN